MDPESNPPPHATEKLDQIAQDKAPLSAKTQAYRRIINIVKRGLTAYYTRYPERATDERSKDAEDWSIRGIEDVMRVLDDYVIEYKPGQSGAATTPGNTSSDSHIPKAP